MTADKSDFTVVGMARAPSTFRQSDEEAMGVMLLTDCHSAFGDNTVVRSVDLVTKLIADPERPWAEWKHGRPLTQKQLGGLLRPFGIVSETVSIPGFNDAKGYRRTHFEEAWSVYCPGQNAIQADFPLSKRRSVGMPMKSAQEDETLQECKGGDPLEAPTAPLQNAHPGDRHREAVRARNREALQRFEQQQRQRWEALQRERQQRQRQRRERNG
jgi:Protein of unknown function (DUF3631)